MQPNRVAVITGAASGIGLASAERLAADGFIVLLLDRSEQVTERAAALRERGLQAASLVGDLIDPATIPMAAQVLRDRYGRCDVLMNNAGVASRVFGKEPSFLNVTQDEWEFVVAVNMTAPFLLSQAVFPLMQANKWGRIINVASRAGRTLVRGAGVPYHATKAGVIGLTRALAGQGGRHGITANTIAPGRVVTPLSSQTPDDMVQEALKQIPVRRLGVPQDIASAVSFLASEESSFITGAVLDVNGGGFMA
ncbi:MAG: 3-oxoacyl-[acyl-carrier protein] reductase [Acetobacteraceae bacterium]|jgi:3-oxoacyl-[acyl-carrier protein] reductase|nr:3-oxoacyl-[acyl-carrier protein] reductase [Acetobacteraceae bacterium]